MSKSNSLKQERIFVPRIERIAESPTPKESEPNPQDLAQEDRRRKVRLPYYETCGLGVEYRGVYYKIKDISCDGLRMVAEDDQFAFSMEHCYEGKVFINSRHLGNISFQPVHKEQKEGKTEVGVNFKGEAFPNDNMIAIDPFYNPLAFFEHPLALFAKVYFKVTHFNSKYFIAHTNNHDLPVFKMMKAFTTLLIPGQGEMSAEMTIEAVDYEPNGSRILISFTDTSITNALGSFLYATGARLDKRRLKNLGFRQLNTQGEIAFLNASGAMKESICQLRYQSSKELDESGVWNEMDDQARHIVGLYHGQVVAATRLIVVGHELAKSEHVSQYNIKLPSYIIKAGFVESSRTVVHHDFRGTDIFMSIMTHIGRVAFQEKYPYMILSCGDNLVESYSKLGARVIGEFEQDKQMWKLMVLDLGRATQGKDMALTTFSFLYKPASKWLRKYGYIETDILTDVRIKTADVLEPVFRKLKARSRGRKK